MNLKNIRTHTALIKEPKINIRFFNMSPEPLCKVILAVPIIRKIYFFLHQGPNSRHQVTVAPRNVIVPRVSSIDFIILPLSDPQKYKALSFHIRTYCCEVLIVYMLPLHIQW